MSERSHEQSRDKSDTADADMSLRERVSVIYSLLRWISIAVDATRRQRRLGLLTSIVGSSYFILYLWGVGHLAPGLGGWGITVVSDPVTTFTTPALGPFSYRPIARIQTGPLTYLLSLNSVIGFMLAILVGMNVAGSVLLWRQPKACGLHGASGGMLAGIPGLISGTACCGPVILLVLGIQASSIIITAFELLVPAAVGMLIISLIFIGRQIEQTL
jgi:hypothetical protein